MKKKFLVICLGLSAFLLCGCHKSNNDKNNLNNNSNVKEESTMEKFTEKINININDKTYTASLIDNETSRELLKKLPLNMTMTELNGNEFYYYLDSSLPSNPKKVEDITIGDIMLYGDDCIVIFYDSFKTNYSYTRLGKIDDGTNLKDLKDQKNVKVNISK